jgi:uncharacterized protein
LGLAQLPLAPPPAQFDALRLSEVVDREHDDDRFVREWKSFDAVQQGEVVGLRADGSEVRAPTDGHIVFPDAGATPGHEWFYFAQKSTRPLL